MARNKDEIVIHITQTERSQWILGPSKFISRGIYPNHFLVSGNR